jgi:hypothetical protein
MESLYHSRFILYIIDNTRLQQILHKLFYCVFLKTSSAQTQSAYVHKAGLLSRNVKVKIQKTLFCQLVCMCMKLGLSH